MTLKADAAAARAQAGDLPRLQVENAGAHSVCHHDGKRTIPTNSELKILEYSYHQFGT